MSPTRASCSFKVESWDEEPIGDGPDGRKSTHATVKQSITGDVTGTGIAHWLMCYRPDGTADYVGLQQVEGRLGDRAGTFTCSSTGTFDGQTADGTLEILAGSGTGDFEGVSGTATFSAPHGDAASVEFDLRA
jgi:Protein of unknown function (DUF3224)